MTVIKKALSCPGPSSSSSHFPLGLCLCGRQCQSYSDDYCSSFCARKDAMDALVGGMERRKDGGRQSTLGDDDDDDDEGLAEDSGSQRPKSMARIMSEASRRLTGEHPYLVVEVADDALQPRLSVRLNKRVCSHYRRKHILQGRAEYQSEDESKNILNDFASDLTGDHFGEEEEDIDDENSSTLGVLFSDSIDDSSQAQMRTITSLLDSQRHSIACTVSDSNAETPKLDCYEDPVGWEGGGRVQSSNFLGLFQMAQLHRQSIPPPSSETSSEGEIEVEEKDKLAGIESLTRDLTCSESTSSGKATTTRKSRPPMLWLPPDVNHSNQRRYIAEASSCASTLLPPTPTSPALSFRRLISSPSKKCGNLFQRKPSKKSLRNGISNRDEPSWSKTERDEVDLLVSKMEALIASKWNPFPRRSGIDPAPNGRSRAYTSHQPSQPHPVLATAPSQSRHRHHHSNDTDHM